MSVPEQQITAGRQVVAHILGKEVAELTKQIRAVLEDKIEPDTAVAAKLPDGTRIGKVLRTRAATTTRVRDEAALLAWVKAHRPAEIVESVNPAYVRALLDQAKRHGHAFDTETGEVIPGIEQAEGSAAYRPTPSREARAIVLGRLAQLVQDGTLALPSGDDDG